MQLRQWISELNAAVTERDIVAVMDAFVKQVRSSTSVPDQCLPPEAGNAAEIRKAAACLAELRFTPGNDDADRDAYQQLLVLFSLAVDRLSLLQARGLLESAPYSSLAKGWRTSEIRPLRPSTL